MDVPRILVTEYELHKFCVEASTLGMTRFPTELTTDLGNGNKFGLMKIDPDGTATYRQDFGNIILRIFNT